MAFIVYAGRFDMFCPVTQGASFNLVEELLAVSLYNIAIHSASASVIAE